MKNHSKVESRASIASEEECPSVCRPVDAEVADFRKAIRALAGKWKMEIMANLADGPRRFGDLGRCLPGITQHMLTAQLRELEGSGLLVRTAYAEVPPRVQYELTEAAYALRPLFTGILEWSKAYAVDLRKGDE